MSAMIQNFATEAWFRHYSEEQEKMLLTAYFGSFEPQQMVLLHDMRINRGIARLGMVQVEFLDKPQSHPF